MKEIDFLPEWYMQGRLAQVKHREFYVAIGLVVFFMGIWSVFANGRAAIVKAQNAALQESKLAEMNSVAEYDLTEEKYQQIKTQQQILDSIKSHITVSNVIAELTHLLDSNVVLEKLTIKAEPFSVQNSKAEIKTAFASGQTEEADKSIRFKITLTGVAADTAKVAEIINKLEQSDYFFQVVPGYSRNLTTGQYQASEFEITCYLSNYKLES
ncbi:MAG: PilN domain-containing protein [Phycisphaerae bacterium]|nr:PilN domain-containing protein [Phycisphaerae bacterium]